VSNFKFTLHKSLFLKAFVRFTKDILKNLSNTRLTNF
jgi:hypothetical protein